MNTELFDHGIERHHTDCSKYDGLKTYFGESENILALWVADMDFPVPEEVTEALKKRAEHPVYGYNLFPSDYYTAFIQWQEKRHAWHPSAEWLCHTPGVLTALANAILCFTEKGDKVLIQPPVYFPFKSTIETLGRKVINNELIYENGHFLIDFDDLKEKAEEAKLFIFCSPHNPSGRVWTKNELSQVEEICQENHLLVFSDEIHSDIVYEPNRHTVFAALTEWSREHSIVAMAPSKTFNLAGLEMSVISVANPLLRERYQNHLRLGLHCANPNSFGMYASRAAYLYGEEWYRGLMSYLRGNLDYLNEALKAEVPEIKLVYPEGTYILLLDTEELHMSPDQLKDFFIHRVKAALNSGEAFGPGGERFMRINIATQRSVLQEFVRRLKKAVGEIR